MWTSLTGLSTPARSTTTTDSNGSSVSFASVHYWLDVQIVSEAGGESEAAEDAGGRSRWPTP